MQLYKALINEEILDDDQYILNVKNNKILSEDKMSKIKVVDIIK